MTVFVFFIENRLTYARFKHIVYVVTSKIIHTGLDFESYSKRGL